MDTADEIPSLHIVKSVIVREDTAVNVEHVEDAYTVHVGSFRLEVHQSQRNATISET